MADPYTDYPLSLNHQLVELLDSLSALYTLTTIPLSGVDEETLLARALEALMDNQDMERCAIFLLDSDDRLHFRSGLSWEQCLGETSDGAPWPHHPLPLDQGMMGLAAASGELQHCRSCAGERHQRLVANGITLQDGSLLCVPLRAEQTVLGVLNIFHPDAGFFGHWHERLLLLFANMLGQLLLNHRLLSDRENTIAERTRQLEVALAGARNQKAQYQQLSYVDDLTGLFNRRYFTPRAEELLARSQLTEEGFALIIIDVDEFKAINDNFGHPTGDRVLVDVAEVLRNHLREFDVLARYGGDEFVLALPFESRRGVERLLDRVTTIIHRLNWPHQSRELTITLSIGIACHQGSSDLEPWELLERLLKQADHALYQSKSAGRDRYTFAEPIPATLHTDS